MIKIDGKEIILGKFPDGTPLLKPDIDFSKYEDAREQPLLGILKAMRKWWRLCS